ncbi:MAG: hypothetical protein IPJ61_14400 [Tessaracoccus sp.]|uniref:hypothetical protein n=1 Tax=Tessaracoccus sp. TaxID=1971211 RepID=UPI001ECAC4A8|nr:hypothetical protein [Tessaracoccus sp.]MBK7822203.1 hypothetical protein [Tessaracoccus sp.]
MIIVNDVDEMPEGMEPAAIETGSDDFSDEPGEDLATAETPLQGDGVDADGDLTTDAPSDRPTVEVRSLAPPVGLESDGLSPWVSADIETITNRGEPVAVNVGGVGFTSHSLVRAELERADGEAGYFSDVVYADNRGLFAYDFQWFPERTDDIWGNDGDLVLRFTDISGAVVEASFTVVSDSETPPVSTWITSGSWRPQATGLARLTVGYDGSSDICADGGLRVGVTATGFTPDSTANIEFTPASDPNYNLLSAGLSINPHGDLPEYQSYWAAVDCVPGGVATINIAVTDEEGVRAEQVLELEVPES